MKKKQYQILVGLLTFTLVLFIFSLISSSSSKNNTMSLPQRGTQVFMVPLSGVITAQEASFVLSSLKKISKMSGVKGLILDINSPGGTTGTSQEIYNELMNLRKSGVKIVSVIRDVGASGGYYAASASDIIVANGSSLTGSIGVIMSSMNFKGLADKYGVKAVTFTSGKMKDMLSPFRDMREDEVTYITKMIKDIHTQFVDDVLLGRNGSNEKITKEKLLSVADGRVLTGIDAKEIGLIDVIGGFSVAEQEMKKLLNVDNILIEGFSKNYFNQFMRLFSAYFNGTTNQMTNYLNPAITKDMFLQQYRDVPLYYMSMGVE